jgi:DNA-binding transcriptional LysR family regulator
MLDACIGGPGIAQVLEIGVEQAMRDGLLVDLFPCWSDERFPQYALFPSRRHRAAKDEAFINFCLESLSAAAPVAHRTRPRLPRAGVFDSPSLRGNVPTVRVDDLSSSKYINVDRNH